MAICDMLILTRDRCRSNPACEAAKVSALDVDTDDVHTDSEQVRTRLHMRVMDEGNKQYFLQTMKCELKAVHMRQTPCMPDGFLVAEMMSQWSPLIRSLLRPIPLALLL